MTSHPTAVRPRQLPAGEHYGSVRSWLSAGPLSFAESVYPRASATDWHGHQRACFTALLGGSYREEFGASSLDCAPGNVLFRPAEAVHRDRIGPTGARCLIVELSPEWTRRMREAGVGMDAPRQVRDPQWLPARIARELAQPDDLSPLVLEGLVLELAGSFFRSLRSGPRPPGWLTEARERLCDDFRAPHRLGELAAQAGVHPAHLARSFRRHYGCTIGEFVRQRRVSFACEQLQSGRRSLAEIALAAGFASQAHFSRVFKLLTGLTPGQYCAWGGRKSRTKPSIA